MDHRSSQLTPPACSCVCVCDDAQHSSRDTPDHKRIGWLSLTLSFTLKNANRSTRGTRSWRKNVMTTKADRCRFWLTELQEEPRLLCIFRSLFIFPWPHLNSLNRKSSNRKYYSVRVSPLKMTVPEKHMLWYLASFPEEGFTRSRLVSGSPFKGDVSVVLCREAEPAILSLGFSAVVQKSKVNPAAFSHVPVSSSHC